VDAQQVSCPLSKQASFLTVSAYFLIFQLHVALL
jgi:hypothetical protein